MDHHSPLFRRLLATAVSAAMLLTLTACAEPPAGTEAPRHEPVFTLPQAPTDREPAVTEPPETRPTQPTTTPTTEPATELPIDIGCNELVTDAYRNIWVDDYGYEYCYHIPRINLSSCAAVNEEIYRTLFQIYYQDVEESINEYGDPNLSSINYIWNQADGVISILVSLPSNYADWTDHMIYYVSAQTGERLEAAHLLEVFGVSDRDFRDRVYSALDAYWEGILASWSEEDNEVLLDMSQDLIEQTLADENIQAAVPFISADGDLSFLASIFVPAGGGEVRGLFDLDTGAELVYLECPVDHSSPVNP